MSDHKGGNAIPEITREEHQSNLKAKRVVMLDSGGNQIYEFNPTSYNLKYDEGATYTYIGEATPGTATSAATWRIKRLTNADNTIVWASGNGNFDKIWDNRTGLSYS